MRCIAAFLAALLAACATPPKTITEGPHEIYVTARGSGWASADIAGVRCELSNDKGTWNVSPPQLVTVERSSAPLEVVCRKDGYRETHMSVACRPMRERAKSVDSFGIAMSVAMVPIAVAAAPIAPQLTVYTLANAAAMGGPAVQRQMSDDVCTYSFVKAVMHRDPSAPKDE